MPNIYVRTQPKTGLKSRHRCGMGFTDVWKKLTDIDAATRAALEEDPYLEVSETPTVLVEVAAATQPAAIQTGNDPNNTPESTAAGEDSAQGDSAQSDAGADSTESSGDTQSNEVINDKDASTGGNLADSAANTGAEGLDTEKTGGEPQEEQAAQASQGEETGAELSAAQATQATVAEGAAVGAEKTDHQLKIDVIKASINTLDVANPENWVADGKPKAATLTVLLGYPVTADDRDEAWAQILAERSNG